MYRYSAYCLNFSSEIELSECRSATNERDDFQIIRKALSPPKLEPTNIHRRGIMAQTAIDTNGSLWLHWEGVATYKASNGTLLEVDATTTDPDVLSLFTVSEALGLILFQRETFLLHASAVKIGAQGWIFMGSPGAGKSTTCAAFVKAGCELLSDDLTAITFDSDGKPWILPAYPQLKIWENTVKGLGYDKDKLTAVSEGVNKFSLQHQDNFYAAPVPLDRMVFIHRNEAAPNSKQLRTTELPTETLRHFPMPNQFLTQNVLQRYFKQSLQCGETAQAFEQKRVEGFPELENWVKERISEVSALV